MNWQRVLSYPFLLAAMLMIAINITTSKYLLAEHMPVLLLLQARFLAACLVLAVGYGVRPQRFVIELKALPKADWLLLFAQAICAGVLFNAFMLLGLHYTSASVAGIITSALPAMIAIFSLILLREKLGPLMWCCVLFATVGLLAMSLWRLMEDPQQQNSLLGDLLIIVALVPEAIYYVLVKIRGLPLSPLTLSVAANGINFLVLLPITLIALGHEHIAQVPLTQWLLAGLVGLSSGFFFVFWLNGCRYVSAARAGLVTAMVPIFTMLVSFIFLGERVNAVQLLGMTMILLSIVFSARSKL